MGTRSLLAVETKIGHYHVQYMQFDGYPSCKGHNYYASILHTLVKCPSYFITKSGGLPNKKFRDRIISYLNEIQYQSGHSIDNHFEVTADQWHEQDHWQEWQYLFKRNGDFEFFNTYAMGYTEVIPWEFTRALIGTFHGELFPMTESQDASVLTPFFDSAWTCEEDEKFYAPKLKVTTGQILAFPEQKNGWRNFGTVFLKRRGEKDKILCESTFAQIEDKTHVRKLKNFTTKVIKE